MNRKWRKVTVIVRKNGEKKSSRTLTSFLNSRAIGPGEVVTVRSGRRWEHTDCPDEEVVLLVYTAEATLLPDEIEVSDF